MMRSLFLLFCLFVLFAHADEWRPVKSVSLQKDQLEQIVVTRKKKKKLFEFRWTLYADNALVVLHAYDDFVAQTLLRLHYNHRSFCVELLAKGKSHAMPPYLVVTFKQFDFETKQARFDIYLSDDNERVTLKFLQETM